MGYILPFFLLLSRHNVLTPSPQSLVPPFLFGTVIRFFLFANLISEKYGALYAIVFLSQRINRPFFMCSHLPRTYRGVVDRLTRIVFLKI